MIACQRASASSGTPELFPFIWPPGKAGVTQSPPKMRAWAPDFVAKSAL